MSTGCSGQDDFAILFLVLHILITLLALCGNTFILYSVVKFKFLRSATNIFVVSLAISDLLTALTIPFYVSFYFDVPYKCDKYACLLRFLVVQFSTLWSLMIMIGLAVDRYIAVCVPLRYNTLITSTRVLLFVFVTAVYLLVMCSLPLLDEINTYDSDFIAECDLYYLVSPAYALPVVCGHVGLAIVTTSCIYFRVFNEAIKCYRTAPSTFSPRWHHDMTCTMLLVFGVRLFVLCPYLVSVFMRYAYPEYCQQSLALAKKISTVMYFSKAFTSPFLCGSRNAGFRTALKQTFNRK